MPSVQDSAQGRRVLLRGFAQLPLYHSPRSLGRNPNDRSSICQLLRTLPAPLDGEAVWGVYLLVYKNLAPKQRYMGSGIGITVGVQARLSVHERPTGHKTNSALPRFVRIALCDGYTCGNIGLLCWDPIPSPTIIPSARVRFIAVEPVFAYLFRAVIETKLDALWAVLLPWKRDTVHWLPLCSHTALLERPSGDISMTYVQLQQYNDEHQRHVKEQLAIRAKAHRDKERAEDLDAFLAQGRKHRAAEKLRNLEKASQIAAWVRARAKAPKAHVLRLQYRSAICDGTKQAFIV
jgi:hypothetical protein